MTDKTATASSLNLTYTDYRALIITLPLAIAAALLVPAPVRTDVDMTYWLLFLGIGGAGLLWLQPWQPEAKRTLVTYLLAGVLLAGGLWGYLLPYRVSAYQDRNDVVLYHGQAYYQETLNVWPHVMRPADSYVMVRNADMDYRHVYATKTGRASVAVTVRFQPGWLLATYGDKLGQEIDLKTQADRLADVERVRSALNSLVNEYEGSRIAIWPTPDQMNAALTQALCQGWADKGSCPVSARVNF